MSFHEDPLCLKMDILKMQGNVWYLWKSISSMALLKISPNNAEKTRGIFGTKYSRVDQVNFVEDSL